jgi:FkbM family methyltransferase
MDIAKVRKWKKWFSTKIKGPSKSRLAQSEFERLACLLGPSDIAIDCGANIGRFTRILAQTGATVHAFEPDPYSFQRLAGNVADLPNVYVRQQAVGERTCRTVLYRAKGFEEKPEHRSLSSSVWASKKNIDATTGFEVEQIDLVAFIADLPKAPTMVKIDVEGAEVAILEALFDSDILHRIGHLFVETHEGKVPELAQRTVALRERVLAEGRKNINLDWA